MSPTIETVLYFWTIFVKVILILILVYSIFGFFLKKFSPSDLRYNTFGLIFVMIQLVLKIIYILISGPFKLLLVKKIVFITIPVLFVSLGWSLHIKQFESKKKFLRIVFFYGLGLLFLVTI